MGWRRVKAKVDWISSKEIVNVKISVSVTKQNREISLNFITKIMLKVRHCY